jgi:hypothetical protein
MKNTSALQERLQRAFAPTHRGVVGVVDDLLELCREQGLQLTWNADQCTVRLVGTEPQESVAVPLQKSVFRAILARLAALCNEQSPNSVSPYGGQGELSVGTDPPMVFRVAFTNTPGEQRLEVRQKAEENESVAATTAARCR